MSNPPCAPLPLALESVTVSAAGTPLIQPVDCTVSGGSCFALLGPSGCGKTTLLRAIAALTPLATGRVTLGGQTPPDWGVPHFRRHVTYVHQSPALGNHTVREALMRPFSFSGNNVPFPEEEARCLLDRLALGQHRLDQSCETLSIGQRQRVALIRSLLIQPTVLLLDEPTSALDPDNAQLIEDLILHQWLTPNRAVLLVSHDLAQTERWSDGRTIILTSPTTPEIHT